MTESGLLDLGWNDFQWPPTAKSAPFLLVPQKAWAESSLSAKGILQMSHQVFQKFQISAQGWTTRMLFSKCHKGPVMAWVGNLCQIVCILIRGVPLVRGSED